MRGVSSCAHDAQCAPPNAAVCGYLFVSVHKAFGSPVRATGTPPGQGRTGSRLTLTLIFRES